MQFLSWKCTKMRLRPRHWSGPCALSEISSWINGGLLRGAGWTRTPLWKILATFLRPHGMLMLLFLSMPKQCVYRRGLLSVCRVMSVDYLNNIRRADDLIVIVYCPEAPHIPSFSFRSKLTHSVLSPSL